MEFTSLILPITKNICRTCMHELDSTMFMNIQDAVEHEMVKIKIIDILVFLNCLENNDEENWPTVVCSSCVSTALVAYNFKLSCLKANATLSQILSMQSSPMHMQRTDIDSIDINVVYQDHEYDVPLFSNQPIFNFESTVTEKELTPLPPVTEITSTGQPPRKEGEKCYTCNVCYQSFTRIYGLRHHMIKHSDLRKYLCSKCGKRFFTLNGLKQHFISHKEAAQFKCGFCNKTYKSKQSLKEHFRVAHSTNRKLFICVTCGKSFTARSTLTMHSRMHTGERKFPCPHCPKSYTRSTYLRAHIVEHTGKEKPRPYLCRYTDCGRSFVTKHSLTAHLAHTHSTERPHKCDNCNKGFPTKSGLKIHKESHNSEIVNCTICNKSFSSKRYLQRHMKVHDVDASEMILETVVDNVFFDEVY